MFQVYFGYIIAQNKKLFENPLLKSSTSYLITDCFIWTIISQFKKQRFINMINIQLFRCCCDGSITKYNPDFGTAGWGVLFIHFI